MKQIAIFASGQGSNAMNLLAHALSEKDLVIDMVVVDQAKSKLPALVRELYPQTEVFLLPAPNEEKILKLLAERRIDWIFLAGYMRILSPHFVRECRRNGKSRIINIHPSLLPAYPGLHAYERAFQNGDEFGGVTIHIVDEGVDTGEIILQARFPRHLGDTLQDFEKRGKALEWTLYPEILKNLKDYE